MKKIVILGAGTAGTIMANRLCKTYKKQIRAGDMGITVVDQNDDHVYQPGLLFVPFGMYQPKDIVRSRTHYLPDDVQYLQSEIQRVEATEDRVYLGDGQTLGYDVLIVATGAQLVPEETEGLLGDGWREKVFDFYTMEGATALSEKMANFKEGKLVVNFVDLPIKCPVAPLEFIFLADSFFRRRGVRENIELTLVTSLDHCFTRPVAAKAFGSVLEDKGIHMVTDFATGSVDGAAGKLTSWDEREMEFDLLISIPLHGGASFVAASPGLGDELNFVKTHKATLQAECKENIFALGDATNVPTSKAGSVAHFQSESLIDNIVRFIDGKPLEESFDGHTNCFIETGFDKAMLIDFNYEVEPLPGTFPLAGIGPMQLLKETRLNHWGKLMFKWIYWNMLLRGRDLPMVSSQMSMKGKKQPVTTDDTANAA